MLKKIIAVLSAALAVCLCLLPAAAKNETGVITVRLNSDVAGCTLQDTERLLEIISGDVVYGTPGNGPVSVADYAGTPEFGKLEAGRTYNIRYRMSAAEGYELPEAVTSDNVRIEGGKGVNVYSVQITRGSYRDGNGELVWYRGLMIRAEVLVDGNAFQRLIGWFRDLILKIKAWSLY